MVSWLLTKERNKHLCLVFSQCLNVLSAQKMKFNDDSVGSAKKKKNSGGFNISS